MANFVYQAIAESGATVRGKVQAESAQAAEAFVASQGFIPVQISREDTGLPSADRLKKVLNSAVFTRINTPELILFTKQFRTMFKAGVPITRIFEVLAHQNDNPTLSTAASEMGQSIREGSSLYDAFSKHPKIFSQLYCSMVRAGEAGNILPEILDRLIYILGHEYKVRKDILSALTYPLIVMFFLVGAFFILLTFVLPKFTAIFVKAGVTLPLPTRVCIGLYKFLFAYWPFLLIGVVLLVVGLALYFRTPNGRFFRDKTLLSLPAIGPVLQKSALSRFSSIFAMLQSSGVTALQSVEILSDTIGNAAISRDFSVLKKRLEEGAGLSEPLRASKYFTPMVVDMIAIGEESGNLDDMLREISNHYDSEVEYAVNRMAALIGPVLVVGLAAVVGFFALAIFMPLADMSRVTMTQMQHK